MRSHLSHTGPDRPGRSWLQYCLIAFAAIVLLACNVNTGDGSRQNLSAMQYARASGLLIHDSIFEHWPIDTSASADECTRVAPMLAQVCAEVLPMNGRIWFETESGRIRWCDCENLQFFTTAQYDTLRMMERLRWRERIKLLRANAERANKLRRPQRRDSLAIASPAVPVPPGPTTFSLAPTTTDIAATEDEETCITETFSFLGGTVTLSELRRMVYCRYPIFRLKCDLYPGDLYTAIVNDANLDNARGWDPADGELPYEERVIISIPSGLMEHPDVEGELILFFLLHEVGHVLGSLDECTPGWNVVCEGQADVWASYKGLRAVAPGTRGIRIGRAARRQLENYVNDVESGFQKCGWCVGCADNDCGYPPLKCRLLSITSGLRLDPVPECISDWYEGRPSYCVSEYEPCSGTAPPL